MKFARRLDALQQKYPALGFPIAVTYKFLDDQGVYLAALIAYYGFISLFPLLLLLSTVLGFVLAGHPELQQVYLYVVLSPLSLRGPLNGRTQMKYIHHR